VLPLFYRCLLQCFRQKNNSNSATKTNWRSGSRFGPRGQLQKKGTPTMGGLIILSAIVIPTILFARLDNIYIILMLITTIFLGFIGFLDDYIKVFLKNKKGWLGNLKYLGKLL
jgi:UDP-N-acetylmuramyl pentapeptide phosphotransferase/UDP-N-acetylglucosamine-1-phosphate transferase